MPSSDSSALADSLDTDPDTAGSDRTSVVRWLVETALLLAVAFALAQGVKTFVVQPFMIPTGSMIPTIGVGDYILAEKLTYRFWGAPSRGDIIVFDDPMSQHPQLIKRVIATEGETVDIRDNKVYVDGEPLAEAYVHGLPTTPGTVATPLVVPSGHVWVMGDNRPNSGDSRYFGPRPISSVHGRAFWTYWPPGEFAPLD